MNGHFLFNQNFFHIVEWSRTEKWMIMEDRLQLFRWYCTGHESTAATILCGGLWGGQQEEG